MRNIAFVFFLAAVLCVTAGMVLGLYMAASENHVMVGAHAHLNLVEPAPALAVTAAAADGE
jgi:hypothetical protein